MCIIVSLSGSLRMRLMYHAARPFLLLFGGGACFVERLTLN